MNNLLLSLFHSNEEEYAEEIKALGFEDSGADVNVGCFSEKQKFRMKVTDEFEAEVSLTKFSEFENFTVTNAISVSLPGLG